MKKTISLAALALTILAQNVQASTASIEPNLPQYQYNLSAWGETKAPMGWRQFCADHAYECKSNTIERVSAQNVVVLDKQAWADLNRLNNHYNKAITPITDQDHWGAEEKWSYATDGKGDCEDYVLEKRRALIAKGWPASALLITVVRDKKGDGHAVLSVRTDRGDMILDNQETKILAAQDTGYQFIKRQSEWNQNVWVSFGVGQGAPATASR